MFRANIHLSRQKPLLLTTSCFVLSLITLVYFCTAALAHSCTVPSLLFYTSGVFNIKKYMIVTPPVWEHSDTAPPEHCRIVVHRRIDSPHEEPGRFFVSQLHDGDLSREVVALLNWDVSAFLFRLCVT